MNAHTGEDLHQKKAEKAGDPLAAAGHAQVRGENQISGPKEHGEESKAGDENAACAHCDTS